MSETGPGTTRRTLLAQAGVATAVGVTAVAGPASTAEAHTGGVATGRSGETAVEFRGRITQSGHTGQTFTCDGFLIAVRGLPASALFSGGAPAVGTALFTAHASGDLKARVLDQSVHSLDIVGRLAVYRRGSP